MSQELVAAIAGAGLVLALLALVLVLLMLWRGLRRRQRGTSGRPFGGGDVQLAVVRAFERLDELSRRVEVLSERLPAVEAQASRSVQRVGVVRFNPFEDTGGNQSFALALLDSKSDGIVISSLHTRQQTRLYLKAIAGGTCETALSAEETEALRRAMSTG